MKKSEIKARIDTLRREIEEHNYRYYVLNQPVISDFEYDVLLNELDNLEKKFPEFMPRTSKHLGSLMSWLNLVTGGKTMILHMASFSITILNEACGTVYSAQHRFCP